MNEFETIKIRLIPEARERWQTIDPQAAVADAIERFVNGFDPNTPQKAVLLDAEALGDDWRDALKKNTQEILDSFYHEIFKIACAIVVCLSDRLDEQQAIQVLSVLSKYFDDQLDNPNASNW